MDFYEFGPMNKQEMIEYLREMESLEKKIPKLIDDVHADVETMEESIRRNTFHHPEMEDGGAAPSKAAGDKVYSTLMATYRDMEHQKKILQKEENRYKTALNKLNIVKRCVNSLSDDEKNLITEIYIKHMSFKLYEHAHNISKSNTYRIKDSALENLVSNYNKVFKNSEKGEMKS